MTTTITVTNVNELYAALKSATGGDVVMLAGGDYGSLNLSGLSYSSDVSIVSADTDNPAIVHELTMNGSSHVVLDGIVFDYVPVNGGSDLDKPFQVADSSYITIRNSVFDGVESGYGAGKALVVTGSNNITIEYNEIFGFWKGLTLNTSTDSVVRGNDVHDLRSDGFNFHTIDGLLVEGNHFHDFQILDGGGDHRDMIQWWTLNESQYFRNVTITDNFFDAGDGAITQSIFSRNVLAEQGGGISVYWENITITDNVIYNAHVNGIVVGATAGLIVSNNTLLYDQATIVGTSEFGRGAPQIRLVDYSVDVTVENNIVSKAIVTDPSWTVGNNLLVQLSDPSGANYYGHLFVNALALPASLDDLRAIQGGLIQSLGVGAEMTRSDTGFDAGPGTTWVSDPDPTPDPVPTPDPDPAPDPDPTPDTGAADGKIGLEDLVVEIWDAKRDVAIATLQDGAVIDPALLKSMDTTIAVRAASGGDLDGIIGSVRLDLDGLYKQVERAAPYTLFGDRGGDAKGGLSLADGSHSLSLGVFQDPSAKSGLLGDLQLSFSLGVAPTTPTTPTTTTTTTTTAITASSPVATTTAGTIGLEDLMVELWDSRTDSAIMTLSQDAKVDAGSDVFTSGSATIAIQALASGDLDGKVGSIRLSVDDAYMKIENTAPYTLFGDKNGDASGGLFLDAGDHDLRIEVYSQSNGTGDLLGNFIIDFSATSSVEMFL